MRLQEGPQAPDLWRPYVEVDKPTSAGRVRELARRTMQYSVPERLRGLHEANRVLRGLGRRIPPYDPARLMTAATEAGLRFVVIGTGALALHGGAVHSKDADFLVTDDRESRETASAVVAALLATPEPKRPGELRNAEATGYASPAGSLDFYWCIDDIAPVDELIDRGDAELVDIGEGVKVWVMRPELTIAGKVNAGRAKDRTAVLEGNSWALLGKSPEQVATDLGMSGAARHYVSLERTA